MRRGQISCKPLLFILLSSMLMSSGCIVKSRCQADYDCAANERCNRSTGECSLECTREEDCWVDGAYIGKVCLDHQCVFQFTERIAAPNFCLTAINPLSRYFGQDVCLDSLKGKVVLLYFGWLT